MPHPRPLPSRELLAKCLNYDPNTGKFVWRERTPDTFEASETRPAEWVCRNWNATYAGQPAFTTKLKNGYHSGTFSGRKVYAHRVAWKLMTGEDPEEIDHVNRIRSDNRWSNLRSTSTALNGRNASLQKRNSSGHPGVQRDLVRDRWYARITVDRNVIFLGRFELLEDAITARKAAEQDHGFSPTHGRHA